VHLNGARVRNPESPVRLGKDRVEVDGVSVSRAEKIYFMLNKPRGIVTSSEDERGRKTVYSLLPCDLAWMAPVGRLDMASEGLLLLTNDSEWGARITDPESHLDKTYHVQVRGDAGGEILDALARGIRVSTGEVLKAKRATLLRRGAKQCWLEIVLNEGKNRQIRKMLDALGVEVVRLIRVSIGSLGLGDLRKGSSRALRLEEKEGLDYDLERCRGARSG
jgi:23S rRNA pseudouridine2605 synthase